MAHWSADLRQAVGDGTKMEGHRTVALLPLQPLLLLLSWQWRSSSRLPWVEVPGVTPTEARRSCRFTRKQDSGSVSSTGHAKQRPG